jgi:hypothetical protein
MGPVPEKLGEVVVSAADFNVRDLELGTETWLTPRWITKPLGDFDLDPCGYPAWPIAARHYIWPDADGLLLPWAGRVFCNPPYGTQDDAWTERMANHRNGYLLLFARTDTQRFARLWRTADVLFFFEGRIRFCREDGTEGEAAPAPSVLIAFGKRNADILGTVDWRGSLVTGWCAH